MSELQHPIAPNAMHGGMSELFGQCITMVLDEIDYGVMLVTEDAALAYANRVARAHLRQQAPLDVRGGFLGMSGAKPMSDLRQAIQAASREGKRRLLSLDGGDRPFCVAVIPLAQPLGGGAALVLLLVGKQSVCEKLSAHWYGVSHGLTLMERAVLEGLLAGMEPTEIAHCHQVSVSTVRTQIASLRSKTGAGSINKLLRQIALLPPVVSALRLGEAAAQPAGV